MRWRLTPRDASFPDLFAQVASRVAEGGVLLGTVLAARGPEREAALAALEDVERAADDAVHLVVRRLGSTLLPPFDRRDVYVLAQQLDECLDHICAAAQMVHLHRLEHLPPASFELAGVLQRQGALTASAMTRLGRTRELAEYWVEVNRLENRADGLARHLLADALGDSDLRRALQVRDVVSRLDAASDAFERVAQTVESIALVEP